MSDEKKVEPIAIEKREPLDIFAHFDALDDAAIVDELEGRLAESAVYHFKQDGKELWGLAKVGVDWCATELAKKGYILRDEELHYELDPTDAAYVLFSARVGKYFVDKSGVEAKVDATIGTKRQGVKIRRRDGTTMADPFWFEKGSQKAIRNARMRLIPEETKAAIITAARGGGRVREVKREELESGAGASGGQTRESRSSRPSPAPSHSNAYAERMEALSVAKQAIGESDYYRIMGEHGYEHKGDIRGQGAVGKMDAVLEDMRRCYDIKRGGEGGEP